MTSTNPFPTEALPRIVALQHDAIQRIDQAVISALKLIDATSAAVLAICEKDPELRQHADTLRPLREIFAKPR